MSNIQNLNGAGLPCRLAGDVCCTRLNGGLLREEEVVVNEYSYDNLSYELNTLIVY